MSDFWVFLFSVGRLRVTGGFPGEIGSLWVLRATGVTGNVSCRWWKTDKGGKN